MTFETWWEQYERDETVHGNLYNAIDLEMAYGAGQRAGYLEGIVDAPAAYQNGHKGGMLRAAEIAEEHKEDFMFGSSVPTVCYDIATAIRKEC